MSSMKVVMVNDCAYVGETLIKYLPKNFFIQHLKRSGGFFDKTLGIAWKIFRTKGDIYHIHYLLQECWLALKLGKHPVIGHAHGSDLRKTINHRVWGRIVRYNLKNCRKVLVSTPDILEGAREFNENAEYLPNPVDTSIFYPKPLPKRSDNDKLHVLIGSANDWKTKGTDIAIQALSRIREHVRAYIIRYGKDFDKTLKLANSLGLKLHVLPKVPHVDVRNYYWNADLVIDQFPKSGTIGMVALEAIACGRPVITHISSEYFAYRDFPLKDIYDVDKIVEILVSKNRSELWSAEYRYLIENHQPQRLVKKVQDIYLKVRNRV